MELIEIGNTDVILQDLGKGRGKIIISDTDRGSFSYYWGSMGTNLKEFIKGLNADYFCGKMCEVQEFCSERTMHNVRELFEEGIEGNVFIMENPSLLEELNEAISGIDDCYDDRDAVNYMGGLIDGLLCYGIDWEDEQDYKESLEEILYDEPWQHLGHRKSNDYLFLEQLLKDLKEYI